jgi:hypothetical protein
LANPILFEANSSSITQLGQAEPEEEEEARNLKQTTVVKKTFKSQKISTSLGAYSETL